MQMTQQIITSGELCKILGMRKEALRTAIWRIKHGKAPAGIIPPPLNLPGAHARWHVEDVQKWINDARQAVVVAPDEPPTPKPRQETKRIGRPRKASLPKIDLI